MKTIALFASALCAVLLCSVKTSACTGISLHATDGSFVLARTIEWGSGPLKSDYVIIPRGHQIVSFTPSGRDGMSFTAKYGVVGLSVVEPEFMAEGVNEKGLSAGLFYFPNYGSYQPYDPAQNSHTIADLQLVTWILSQFTTVEEVKTAIPQIRVASIDPSAQTLHWRIADASGNQCVLEIIGGQTHFYDNKIGVLTNAPDFPWQTTNLNNYVNLHSGTASAQKLGGLTLSSFGSGSGVLGIPGDPTPPSRFVRAAFFTATAPQQASASDAVLQCFHILNNFDVPVGIEHPVGQSPDIPSATQWTAATDVTNKLIYYRTAYNCNIRCIDCKKIDFEKVSYSVHPLDPSQEQPIEMIHVK